VTHDETATCDDVRIERGDTMDQHRFDTLTRSLTNLLSRRVVWRGLIGAGLALPAAPRPDGAAAKKKRKKQKPKFNAFGCVNVGNFCQTADQCCSGICQGKKGNKRCRAHDTGGCAAGQRNANCGGANVTCAAGMGNMGFCETTTGQAPYCASGYYSVDIPCATDRDCHKYCGPRAACLPCGYYRTGPTCAGPDECTGSP
jgi:hypothetical protein